MDVTIIFDLITMFAFVLAGSGFAWMVSGGKLPRWWFWIALVPLMSWGLAISVMLIPRGYDPDFNTGRADWLALIFYGVILPVVYLVLAVPVALLIGLWKRRRDKDREMCDGR